jgi:hypothetical protein
MSLDHDNEALRIDELAALATMSASSFHHLLSLSARLRNRCGSE